MRFPFVSRERFDEQRAHYEDRIADLTRQRDIADAHRAACEKRLVLLAAEGKQQVVAQREASKLTRAIRDLARQPDGSIDPRLIRHFRSRANELLSDGAERDTDAVINELGSWDTSDRMFTADRIADLHEGVP